MMIFNACLQLMYHAMFVLYLSDMNINVNVKPTNKIKLSFKLPFDCLNLLILIDTVQILTFQD